MSAAPRILFACRANAGRSVIATVLARHYAGDAVTVSSAGSEPGAAVHPEVAAALAEMGLATDGEQPKAFDPRATYDVIITMGCGESCPVYPGARYEDWPVADPKGAGDGAVRAIVADIDRRVRGLLGELRPDLALPSSPLDLS